MNSIAPKLNEPLTASRAAQHLLNRRRARENVIDFAGYIDVPARPVGDPEEELYYPVETNLERHHEIVLETMDRTSKRQFGRAIIMQPPGTAKTTYQCVFSSYYLGKNPGHRIILGSYGDDLAKDMGHKTRSIVKQERYQRLFNTSLTSDSRAADHFLLTNGSGYHAAGYNGDLPGRRCEGAICDDLIKGIAEASSTTERNNVWNGYNNNILTRLLPGAWLVIIMTHWDEDDPCGRILPDDWSGDSGMFKGKDGLDWEVLCLQAQCETKSDPLKRQIGEYMVINSSYSPEVNLQHWQLHQADQRKWNALFQQRPRALEGAFFLENDLLMPVRRGVMNVLTYEPCVLPDKVDYIFATLDSAMKDGKPHDGMATKIWAYSKLNRPRNPPLVVIDWDYIQIKGAFLKEWLPSLFTRMEVWARRCHAIGSTFGNHTIMAEDASSGTVVIQACNHPDWIRAHPHWKVKAIDSKLTKQGKKGKASMASGYVRAGMVKWSREAWEKTVTFKNVTKNHAKFQVLKFSTDSEDTDPDDCLDAFSYGVCLGLGNEEGY